jgi:hypothetical protein
MLCLTKNDKTLTKKIKQPHFLLSSHSNKMIMIELPLPPHLTTLPPPMRDHHTSATIPPHKPWATPGVWRVRALSARPTRPRHALLHFVAVTARGANRQWPTNRLAMPLIRVSRHLGPKCPKFIWCQCILLSNASALPEVTFVAVTICCQCAYDVLDCLLRTILHTPPGGPQDLSMPPPPS